MTYREDSWHLEELDAYAKTPLTHARLFTRSADSNLHFLFVHGAYHGAWCWVPMMRALVELGHGVSAVDIRGHGGLPQADGFLQAGVADAAADVVEAAKYLQSKNIVLIGHSLGGLIVMLAAESLELHALVLMAPSPPGQLKGLVPLPAYPEDALVQPPTGEVAHAKFLAGFKGDSAPALARLCPESPRMMNDRYRLRVSIDHHKIQCPSLCLAAGRDLPHLHPPGQDEAVAHFLGGDYRYLPDSAHDMMLDDHRHEVLRHLLDWLAQPHVCRSAHQ